MVKDREEGGEEREREGKRKRQKERERERERDMAKDGQRKAKKREIVGEYRKS